MYRGKCKYCEEYQIEHRNYDVLHKQLRNHIVDVHRNILSNKINESTMACQGSRKNSWHLLKGNVRDCCCTICGRDLANWYAGIHAAIIISEVTDVQLWDIRNNNTD